MKILISGRITRDPFSHIQYIHHAAIALGKMREDDAHCSMLADFGLDLFIGETFSEGKYPFS